MNGDEDRPVTRRELKAELAEFKAEIKTELADFKGELKSELKSELMGELKSELMAEFRLEFPTKEEMKLEIASAMNYVVDTLGARIDATRDELSRELARHVTASAEQTQRLIIGLDDRYRDLPGRVTVLERELDEHRRDTALHPRRRR